MDFLTIEQKAALLVICVFFLGFLADRVMIWFYHHYVDICESEEDSFEEDENWQEAI